MSSTHLVRVPLYSGSARLRRWFEPGFPYWRSSCVCCTPPFVVSGGWGGQRGTHRKKSVVSSSSTFFRTPASHISGEIVPGLRPFTHKKLLKKQADPLPWAYVAFIRAYRVKVTCRLFPYHTVSFGARRSAPLTLHSFRLSFLIRCHKVDTAILFAVFYLCASLFMVVIQGVVLAKTNTPLFSLGSQGTLADTLTTQKGSSSSILRRKPTPSDPYSLPQAYQRWLYEDYAYLWRQQSTATQAIYRSAGVRHHLTGFQYWMKYQLTNLPDILGWWRLDHQAGALTPDSSKENNPLTIVGASPSPGLIGRSLSFDGLNDYLIRSPYQATLPVGSLECLIVPGFGYDTTSNHRICNLVTTAGLRIIDLYYTAFNDRFSFYDAVGPSTLESANQTFTAGDIIHLCITWDATAGKGLYVNNAYTSLVKTWTPPISQRLIFGIYHNLTGSPYLGTIDNIILYNRILDSTEVLRHSLRRYPP